MGVRIDAHAVDASAFAELLKWPLWWLLTELRRAPADVDVLFHAYDAAERLRYVVLPKPRAVVRLGPESPREEMGDEQLAAVPFMQQDVGSYLRAETSYHLLFLIRALPWVMPAAYAEITWGVRHWWACSVLAAVRGGACGGGPKTAELEGFFARMLRGHSCNVELPPHESAPPDGSFPVLPGDDANMWMAVFDEAESRRLGELSARLLGAGCRFGPPPGLGLEDDAPADWHAHVTAMLARFRRLQDLALPNLRLVTFIG